MSSLADDLKMHTAVADEIGDGVDNHVSDDARGIPLTKWFSTSIQGNLSHIEFVESNHNDDGNISVDVDSETVVIKAKANVGTT
jgi:hypothetical protein